MNWLNFQKVYVISLVYLIFSSKKIKLNLSPMILGNLQIWKIYTWITTTSKKYLKKWMKWKILEI